MKQFKRYRQIADQKMGRANKIEVLSEELLQVEKHIEQVRAASQLTCKKLSQCMQTHAGGDFERRIKRLTETTLGQVMQNASRNLLAESNVNQFLRFSLEKCANAQAGLAKEKATYEMFVDEHVISYLNNVVENEIPAIQKQRTQLKRLVLDRDSASQDYLKAVKAQNTPAANNAQQINAKVEMLKDEYDVAVKHMEQCKDQVITDMFEYLSKEAGHCEKLVDLYSKQLEYHRNCVTLLENMEPEMINLQEKAVVNSFGRPLAEHCRLSQRKIALPIESCVLCLREYGLNEEGIFRIAGGATKQRKFKAITDAGVLDLSPYDVQDDIHAVCGVLKQYLRELPDPLLTYRLFQEWMNIANIQEHDPKLEAIWNMIDELPSENKANLRYLIRFCATVAEHQETNKMSPSNLALVLAPNFLWSNSEDMSTGVMVSNVVANVVEQMIIYFDYFFPGDIEFAVTPIAISYGNQNNNEKTPLSPGVQSRQGKFPTHTRSSSNELILSDNAVSGKLRKPKSKAPPPPQQSQPVKTHERTKSSPPTLPDSPARERNSGVTKPPVAPKRMSSRKPLISPPPPPKEDNPAEELASSNPKPAITRPRPQMRKHHNNHVDAVAEKSPPQMDLTRAVSSSPTNSATLQQEQTTRPLPDFPPPPSLGAGTVSTVKSQDSNHVSFDSSDEECQFTAL